MMFTKYIFAVGLMMLVLVVTASADTQIAHGTIVGDDNHQIVTNDNTQQDTSITVTDGNDNTIIAVNDNSNGQTNNNVANQYVDSSSSTVLNILNTDDPDYYGLNIGVITTQIISLYNGQVIVAMNDDDKGIIQKEGDNYRYTVQSSLPVLTYIINANDANRAEFDTDVAPTYDPCAHKFDLGNLNTIFVSKYRSPQQQFDITIPENGRYALVIDTRVSQRLNGQTAKIVDDSIDVLYSIEKMNKTTNRTRSHTIGITSTYPNYANGMANTS